MRKTGFYFKMAWSNIAKNQKFYIPYILTSFITITMFFTLQSFCNNSNIPDSSSFKMLMGFGLPVVLLFSAIFLFYTNSFLIRRRKTEFGLFNILGMEKRHIAALIVIETIIIAAISLVLGLGFGILTNKLLFLVLNKVVEFTTPLVFEFSVPAITKTAGLFALIYIAILIKNVIEVLKVKPIELLSAQKTGEKEPKVKWVLSVFGALCLIAGYIISVTCTDAYKAITLFFVAVVLVIIGTYCLFLSGTIALLKLLKSNKDYYYKTKHFASISGMMFRMKQNGVGLANICILSTMVIVMIGTTVSLDFGASDIINTRYVREITTTFYETSDENVLVDARDAIAKAEKESGIKIENYSEYKNLDVSSGESNNNYLASMNGFNLCYFEFFLPKDYEAYSGEQLPKDLESGVFYVCAKSDEPLASEINFFGKTFKTVDLEMSGISGRASVSVVKSFAVVVADEETFNEVNKLQYDAFSKADGMIPSVPNICVNFDLDCKEKDEHKFFDIYEDEARDIVEKYEVSQSDCTLRLDAAKDFGELTGSFLFLGLFLGVLFLMATVLIMYYKQIVEGYDDKENFNIMQKVGMDKEDVKSVIKSQVLIMFFLPLIVSFIHMGFALPIIFYLLTAFAISNVKLVVICCICTCLVYAVIYGMVYSLTAKTYYRIVK